MDGGVKESKKVKMILKCGGFEQLDGSCCYSPHMEAQVWRTKTQEF
jgi:hypothetical protein